MKHTKLAFGLCLLFVSMLLPSCGEKPIQEPVRFHLFKRDNPAITSPIDRSEEDGWLPLLDVDLSQSDFVIEEDDIVSYDWNEQRIKLNEQINTQFAQAGINALEFTGLSNNYFVLALGDKPIVGGSVSYSYTAVYFRIPVLYFLSDGELQFTEMILGLPDSDLILDVRERMRAIGKLGETAQP